MQQIKNATNSRNEACRGDTEISTRQLTTFVFLINFEADPNGNGYYTEFDISMDGLQEAIDEEVNNGDRVIDAHPRHGAEGLNIAFLHPKSTCGTLVELCEDPHK